MPDFEDKDFQFPNGFSLWYRVEDKEGMEATFQFPNGFSRCMHAQHEYICKYFQFPNGFSLIVKPMYNGILLNIIFQFPNGFSRRRRAKAPTS